MALYTLPDILVHMFRFLIGLQNPAITNDQIIHFMKLSDFKRNENLIHIPKTCVRWAIDQRRLLH